MARSRDRLRVRGRASPLPERRVRDADLLRGDPRHPPLVVAAPGDGGEVIVSANGRSFSVTADPGILALLRRVAAGDPGRAGDLIAGASRSAGSAATAADLRKVLSKLVSLRALSLEARG